MEKWTKVTCSQMDEADQLWRVDAVLSGPDETAVTIALVNDITGAVTYLDPAARADALAQEVIREKVASLGPTIKLKRNQCNISASMTTPLGAMFADFEPKELTGDDSDIVYIWLKANAPQDDAEPADLLAAKATSEGVKLLVWSDIFEEAYQEEFFISAEDIDEALVEC